MRLSWLSLQHRLSGSYRRWLAREREEFGGLFLDEYGQERYTRERVRAMLFECACGFLLSITTYVTIESMFFSFSALEYFLEPLTGDMIFVINSSDSSLFWYIAMCFLPCTLNISTWKTVWMPLYLAPAYLISVILVPMMHLLIAYSSCIRILSSMRSGDMTHSKVAQQIALAFVVECLAWGFIHQFLLPEGRDLFLSEGDAITSTGSAIVALCIGPATAVARFYMEPLASESGSTTTFEFPISSGHRDSDVTKNRSMGGLLGLIVGTAYARTARLYLETIIIFGVGPSLWRSMAENGLEITWIPSILCFVVPAILVYYLTRAALCLVRRGYVAATLLSSERSSREANEGGAIPVTL